ncbi:MAG: hypothetical protein QXG00_02665 [Candidatus Woesearchaeota archaeon]
MFIFTLFFQKENTDLMYKIVVFVLISEIAIIFSSEINKVSLNIIYNIFVGFCLNIMLFVFTIETNLIYIGVINILTLNLNLFKNRNLDKEQIEELNFIIKIGLLMTTLFTTISISSFIASQIGQPFIENRVPPEILILWGAIYYFCLTIAEIYKLIRYQRSKTFPTPQ